MFDLLLFLFDYVQGKHKWTFSFYPFLKSSNKYQILYASNIYLKSMPNRVSSNYQLPDNSNYRVTFQNVIGYIFCKGLQYHPHFSTFDLKDFWKRYSALSFP